jgi:hypothetical protein
VRAEGYVPYGVEIAADGPHEIPVALVRGRSRRR